MYVVVVRQYKQQHFNLLGCVIIKKMLVVGSRTGFTIRQAYFLNQGRLQRNHVQGGFIRTTTYIHTQYVLINVHTANQPGMQKGEYNRHIINLIIGHGHASGPEKIVQALVLVQAKQSYTRSSQIKGCLNERSDAINQNYIHAQMMIYSSFYFIIHHCKNILPCLL